MRAVLLWAAAAAFAMVAAGAGAFALSPVVPVCRLSNEDDRGIDRGAGVGEELAVDFQRVRDAAARFSDAVAKRPLLSDSPDALAGARTAPMRARAWCEETLLGELARRRGGDVALLRNRYERLFTPVRAPQAVAVPTRGTDVEPAVVSRPAR